MSRGELFYHLTKYTVVILSRDRITTVVILSWTIHDRITTIVILSRSYSITLHRPCGADFYTFWHAVSCC